MAVKWIGKFVEGDTGNPPEPARYIVGIPCRDLDDDELREIARDQGKRRDVLERELARSGLFTIVGKPAPEEDEEDDIEDTESEPVLSPFATGFEPAEEVSDGDRP